MIRLSSKGSDPPGASYLWRVAYNATVDEIRRDRRRREEPLDREAGAGPVPDEAGAVEDPELRQVLLRELDRLKPQRRMAVLLQLYGFTVEESARALGWSVKRVDNHRYLGMRDLRRALKEQGLER